MSRAYGASNTCAIFIISTELRAKGVAKFLEKGANLLVYNYIARLKNVTRNPLTKIERRVASEDSVKTGTAEAILDMLIWLPRALIAPARRVWGHIPSENFGILDFLRWSLMHFLCDKSACQCLTKITAIQCGLADPDGHSDLCFVLQEVRPENTEHRFVVQSGVKSRYKP